MLSVTEVIIAKATIFTHSGDWECPKCRFSQSGIVKTFGLGSEIRYICTCYDLRSWSMASIIIIFHHEM